MFRSHTNSSIRKPWKEHLNKTSGKRDSAFHRFCFLANTKKKYCIMALIHEIWQIYTSCPLLTRNIIEIKARGCDFRYRYDWLSMSYYESLMTCFPHIVHKYGGRKEQKQKSKNRKYNPLTPHRNTHSQNGKW